MLKDDLIVKLDQFSNEMLILREEIKSLQTVKAALHLRITELEEESKKAKEELATKTSRIEEEDVSCIHSIFSVSLFCKISFDFLSLYLKKNFFYIFYIFNLFKIRNLELEFN